MHLQSNIMIPCCDPILIGGSFIPYCLGYLTWYEDIDIFMPSFIFPKFLSVFKTETGNFGHVRRYG